MTEKNGTQRKGFVSPLQKAQGGKIGGGKNEVLQERQNVSTSERFDTTTLERSNVESPEEEGKKNKREETHFRQTVWMSKSLNRRLKIQAAKEERDISNIINKLVEDYLETVEN